MFLRGSINSLFLSPFPPLFLVLLSITLDLPDATYPTLSKLPSKLPPAKPAYRAKDSFSFTSLPSPLKLPKKPTINKTFLHLDVSPREEAGLDALSNAISTELIKLQKCSLIFSIKTALPIWPELIFVSLENFYSEIILTENTET